MIYTDYADIPSCKADLILCDPPWNITNLAFDKAGFDLGELAEWCRGRLKPNGWLFLFGPLELAAIFLLHLHRKFEYVWAKPAGVPAVKAAKRPMLNHELIWAFIHKDLTKMADLYMDKEALRTPGKPYAKIMYEAYVPTSGGSKADKRGPGIRMPLNSGYREGATVLMYGHKNHGMPRTEATKHPTQKPLGLLRLLVRAYCPPGGLVLDPTLGSGTAAVAAKMEGRQFVGAELEAKWRKVCEERLAEAKPELHRQAVLT